MFKIDLSSINKGFFKIITHPLTRSCMFESSYKH